jgi:hypothetical protein
MKQMIVYFAAVCLIAFGGAFAAGGDASEGGVSVSPLKIYSGGLGGGFFYPVSDGFKAECGEVFGKVTWMNAFDFTENVALFADINWYAGNEAANFGVDLGVDYVFAAGSRVKPLLGAGAGAHYFYRDGAKEEFGKAFGASVTAHLGIALELTESVQVKIRAPFHAIVAQSADLGAGVDIGIMFINSLRKVRKLDY